MAKWNGYWINAPEPRYVEAVKMIIGECPYCDETECNAIPESVDLPVLGKVQCDKCGEVYWLKYSRVEPQAYKLDYFNKGDLKLVDNSDK